VATRSDGVGKGDRRPNRGRISLITRGGVERKGMEGWCGKPASSWSRSRGGGVREWCVMSVKIALPSTRGHLGMMGGAVKRSGRTGEG
jgi:hypothetical protein